MDQINLLIRQLGTFPGHKTVLLLSPGFTSTGEPDRFQAMLDKANLADLGIYAFDANGLSQTSTAQASSMAMQHVATLSQQQNSLAPGEPIATTRGIGTAGVAERSRQDDYLQDAVRTSDSQTSLRALAEGTDTHYEADYHPSSGKYDGHFRKIEVKLARADLLANAKVASRNGYFAVPYIGGSPPGSLPRSSSGRNREFTGRRGLRAAGREPDCHAAARTQVAPAACLPARRGERRERAG
jgi:hypothetical protein